MFSFQAAWAAGVQTSAAMPRSCTYRSERAKCMFPMKQLNLSAPWLRKAGWHLKWVWNKEEHTAHAVSSLY